MVTPLSPGPNIYRIIAFTGKDVISKQPKLQQKPHRPAVTHSCAPQPCPGHPEPPVGGGRTRGKGIKERDESLVQPSLSD